MISALLISALLASQDLPDGPQPYLPSGQGAAQSVPVPALPPQGTMRPDSPEATTRDDSPLGGAVSVDAYRRNYEAPKDARELSYDSSLLSAYTSKESQMEGSWVVATPDGRRLVGLELRSDNPVSGQLEGAWRSLLAGFGMNNSGFISDVTLTGRDFEITYFAGGSRSPTILHFTQGVDGRWNGYMLDTVGHKTPAVLTKQRPGQF